MVGLKLNALPRHTSGFLRHDIVHHKRCLAQQTMVLIGGKITNSLRNDAVTHEVLWLGK